MIKRIRELGFPKADKEGKKAFWFDDVLRSFIGKFTKTSNFVGFTPSYIYRVKATDVPEGPLKFLDYILIIGSFVKITNRDTGVQIPTSPRHSIDIRVEVLESDFGNSRDFTAVWRPYERMHKTISGHDVLLKNYKTSGAPTEDPNDFTSDVFHIHAMRIFNH